MSQALILLAHEFVVLWVALKLVVVCCRYSFPAEFDEALDHAVSSGKGTKILLRMSELQH